jgi:hypothetical protein
MGLACASNGKREEVQGRILSSQIELSEGEGGLTESGINKVQTEGLTVVHTIKELQNKHEHLANNKQYQ